jgi:hypothetical protein
MSESPKYLLEQANKEIAQYKKTIQELMVDNNELRSKLEGWQQYDNGTRICPHCEKMAKDSKTVCQCK